MHQGKLHLRLLVVFFALTSVNLFAQPKFDTCTSSSTDVCSSPATANVGIGVNQPLARLHVFTNANLGSGAANNIALEGTHPAISFLHSGAQGYLGLATGDGAFFSSSAHADDLIVRSETKRVLIGQGSSVATVVVDGPNVGIGPVGTIGARLEINDGTQLAARLLLSGQEYYQAGGANASGVALLLGVNRTANRQLWFADSTGVGQQNAANKAIRMVVGNGDSAAPMLDAVGMDGSGARLTIGNEGGVLLSPNGGQVSIGGLPPGTLPTDKLVVNGTVRGVNVIATYQDVAEWVPATEDMAPGTVVVVDTGGKNTVAPSARAYDTGVAGVVSAQPGLILGVEGASKAKIATTGRVKVRVDASRGAIRAGDLLVTSDEPGMAMRSETIDVGGVKIHRPGTLIGKALEPLAGGQGEILVLLSLQ